MNIDLLTNMTKGIKTYLEDNKYAPKVTNRRVDEMNKNPVIVIKEENNSTSLVDTLFKDSTDDILISVNIYAQDFEYQNEIIPNIEVARELMSMVDDVMFRGYKMKRKSAKPTPNLDNSIYRITIIYSKKIITNKNILI